MGKKRIGWVGPFLAIWIVGTVGGFFALESHANTPGAPAHAPEVVALRTHAKPRLEVFLHPACPCSHATVSELTRLLDSAHGQLDVNVNVLAPSDQPKSWYHNALYAEAARIPGVHMVDDRDGKIAERFGAETSGQVLLYAPDGKLVFKGGITPARSHEGDNAGSDSILAYLQSGKALLSFTPVFGCALFHRTS